MLNNQIIFYSGIALLVTAVVLSVIAIIGFIVTGKRLKAKLEEEYGQEDSRCHI